MADDIDLSAGLKPKAASPEIDLSAGLTPKPTQTSAMAPSAPQSPLITSGEGQYQMKDKDGKVVPVSYSHVLDSIHQGHTFADKKALETFAADHAADPNNKDVGSVEHLKSMSNWNPFKYLAAIGAGPLAVLEGIGGEAMKTATAFDRPATSAGETEAQLAAAKPPQNPVQAAGAMGEQVGELFTAPETDVAKIAKVGKVAKTALKIGEQGVRAAAEQGAQSYVKTGGDTEEAKRAAEVGGVVGGLSSTLPEVLSKTGDFFKNIIRNRFNIDEVQTEKVIAEARKANDQITKDAEKVHADNVQKVKDARDSGNEADAARLEHDNVVKNQQAIEAKRENLTTARGKTRQAITQRVQAINDAARSYFKKGFDEVKAKLDAPDEETGEVHTVPYADLDQDIETAEGSIKGSRENVKIFEDIGKKAQGVGEKGKKLTSVDIAELDPDELAMLGKVGPDGARLPGAKYSDLDGYYQEAGRIIGNPSTAPDVRQAVVKFREALGKRMQDLAEEVDPATAKQHALLRRQYREYAGGFRDYSGPSDSGSPVAKGLQAKDPYNATKPYMDLKEPEEKARGKKIVVGDTRKPDTQFTDNQIVGPDGKPQPSWKFRKDTHALIDHLRNLQDGLDHLPTPGELEKDTADSATNLEKVRSTAREAANGVLEPLPLPRVDTPETLGKAKADALKISAHGISKFGTWLAVMGPVSAIATFLKTGDIKKSAEIGVGAAAGGLVTPYLLSKLLEQPGVVKSLTTVSRKDLLTLAAMPKNERAGVEETMKQLADKAVADGKVRANQVPWYRIIGGKAAVAATAPAKTETAPAGESEEDIEKDLQQMQSGAPQ